MDWQNFQKIIQKKYKIVKVFNQNYNKNDVVRFMFSTDKFMDPYQSFIEIEVSVDPTKYAVDTNAQKPVLALDG